MLLGPSTISTEKKKSRSYSEASEMILSQRSKTFRGVNWHTDSKRYVWYIVECWEVGHQMLLCKHFPFTEAEWALSKHSWQGWKSKFKLHKLSLLQNSCSRQFKSVTFVQPLSTWKTDSSLVPHSTLWRKTSCFFSVCLFGQRNADFFNFLL